MRKLAVLALLTLAVSLAPAQGYIGRLDTLGTTTYDWQNGWHAMQFLVNAPEHGLHAVWMRSVATSGTTFPDRNMCYSYYDFATDEERKANPDLFKELDVAAGKLKKLD